MQDQTWQSGFNVGVMTVLQNGTVSGITGGVMGAVVGGLFRAIKGLPTLAHQSGTDGIPLQGGSQTGETTLTGLRDAQNLTPGRLQTRPDTCGLLAAESVFEDLTPAGTPRDFTGVREQLNANGGAGLDSKELMSFIGKNLPDTAFVQLVRNATEEQLVGFLQQGTVIAHVDGNHWVRLLSSFEANGAEWVHVYDPGRGYYDQLLTSFMFRAGPNNQMLAIRP